MCDLMVKIIVELRPVQTHYTRTIHALYNTRQARSQAEAEEAAASSDLAQIDNVLIMCSHDITHHFNIWTLCNTLFWDFETDTT